MSPTPNSSNDSATGPSIQLTTAGVVASYIHEISERHRRDDQGGERLSSPEPEE
jgi:hypothetical protein